jgi:transcription elongation GreA/GreB family factor
MSRAFVREQDVEALEELPDRLISSCPNDVTLEGMKHLEVMLQTARESHAAALRAHDRSALAVESREVRLGARRASARVVPEPLTEVRFGCSVSMRRSGGREQTYRIVGEDEADPGRGTISHASP